VVNQGAATYSATLYSVKLEEYWRENWGLPGSRTRGEMQLHAGERTVFRVATYKIENSSAYRTLGQRVYALLTYLAF